MEKYNKQKAILTALLKWVETEFFGIFVFLFFIAVAKPFGACLLYTSDAADD